MTNRERVEKLGRLLEVNSNIAVTPRRIGDITLFQVGRNATHEFYLGVDGEDCLFETTVGVDDIDEAFEKGLPVEVALARWLRATDSIPQYIGHY